MTDREKVIKAIEICYTVGHNCTECPFFYKDKCNDELMHEALTMLKEQEPRVMTLDELTEIYVEFKGNACPVRLSNFDLQKIIMYADNGICRLWIGKPTNEQKEAVKWE